MLFKPNKQLKRNKAVPYMILLCFVPVLFLYISENMMEYTFDSTREVVNISLILILAGLALITAFMNSNDKTKKLVPVFYYKNETLYFNHLSVNMMDDRNLNEKDFKKIEKVNRLIRKKDIQ